MMFFKVFSKDKLNKSEQLVFLDYLQQSLNNGFSFNQSLKILPHVWNEKVNIIKKLSSNIAQGNDIGQSLVAIGFSRTIAQQISFAIKHGNLIESLSQLTKIMRLKNEQIKKIKSEMAYPAVLIVMMVSLLIAMQTFLHSELSSDSSSSDFIFAIIISLIGIFFIGCSYVVILAKKQDYTSFKKLIHVPILGRLVKLYIHYLIVSEFAILMCNGYTLQQICNFFAHETNQSIAKTITCKMNDALIKGNDIEEIIKQEEFLPDSLVLLFGVGADTKELSKKCVLLSQTLFYELNFKLGKAVVSIQPFCFILIGFCILAMYLKILMPMYTSIQNI